MQSWISLQLQKVECKIEADFINGYWPNVLLEYITSEEFRPINGSFRYINAPNRIQNWINFFYAIKKFFSNELSQILTNGLPDVYQFLNSINNHETSKDYLDKIYLLLIGVAINCKNREAFIKEIMENFSPSNQEALMNSIQKLNNNDDEFSMTVNSVDQLQEFISNSLTISTKSVEAIFASRDKHQPDESKPLDSVGSLTTLELELAELRAKNRKLKVELDEQSDQTSELRHQLIEQQREMSHFKQDSIRVNEMERKLLNYKDEVDSLRENLINYQAIEEQNISLKEKLAELDHYKKSCRDLTHDLQMVLEQQEKAFVQTHSDSELTTKLRQKEREITKTIQRITELEKDKEADMKKIQDLNEEVSLLRDDMTRVNEQRQRHHDDETTSNNSTLEVSKRGPGVSTNNISEEIYQTMWRQIDMENKSLLEEVQRLKYQLEIYSSSNNNNVIDENILLQLPMDTDKFNLDDIKKINESIEPKASYFITSLVQSFRDLLKKNCYLVIENQRLCQNLATMDSLKESLQSSALSLAKLENERDELNLRNLELSARIQVLMNSDYEDSSDDNTTVDLCHNMRIKSSNPDEDSRHDGDGEEAVTTLSNSCASSTGIKIGIYLRKKNLSKGQLKGEILRLSSEVNRLNLLLTSSKGRQESLSTKLAHLEILNAKLTKNIKSLNDSNSRNLETMRVNSTIESDQYLNKIDQLERELAELRQKNRELTNERDELDERLKLRRDSHTSENNTLALKMSTLNEKLSLVSADYERALETIRTHEATIHALQTKQPHETTQMMNDHISELEREKTELLKKIEAMSANGVICHQTTLDLGQGSSQATAVQALERELECEKSKCRDLHTYLNQCQDEINQLTKIYESQKEEKRALFVDFEGMHKLHNQLNIDYERCNEQLTESRFNLRKAKLEVSSLKDEISCLREKLQMSANNNVLDWKVKYFEADQMCKELQAKVESISSNNGKRLHSYDQTRNQIVDEEINLLKTRNNTLKTYNNDLEDENRRLCNRLESLKSYNSMRLLSDIDDELGLRERLMLLQKQKEKLEDKFSEKSRRFQCSTKKPNTIVNFVKKAKDSIKNFKGPIHYDSNNSSSEAESYSHYQRPVLQRSKSTVTASAIEKSDSIDTMVVGTKGGPGHSTARPLPNRGQTAFFNAFVSPNNFSSDYSLQQTYEYATDTGLKTMTRGSVEDSITYIKSLIVENPPKVPQRTTSQRACYDGRMSNGESLLSFPVTDRSEKKIDVLKIQRNMIQRREKTIKNFAEKDDALDSGLDNNETVVKNFINSEELIEVASSSNDDSHQGAFDETQPKGFSNGKLFCEKKPLPLLNNHCLKENSTQQQQTKKSIFLLEYGDL